MLSPTHLRREGEDYADQILSKAVKAGRRTYFFDVRATRGDDYFLTITVFFFEKFESKLNIFPTISRFFF